MKLWFGIFVVVLSLLLLPAGSRAQTLGSGTIAGVVKDASGAVLPGVKVEATSPALIEKFRDVVTNGSGEYKIVNLRPGTYTITCTAPGFEGTKQEGIELTAAFTATIDITMKVGEAVQSVTVTTETPMVDTQDVMQANTLEQSTLQEMPIGKSYGVYASITPGAIMGAGIQDVGGFVSEASGNFSIHGDSSNDMNLHQDGMQVNSLLGPGATTSGFNEGGMTETTVEFGGITAEDAYGGVQINEVPREGGNKISGNFFASGTGSGLESDNITPFLAGRGITSASSAKELYDIGGGFGGPWRKNKLWFYVAQQNWKAEKYVPGIYYNADEGPCPGIGCSYVPNLKAQAYTEEAFRDSMVRLSSQITPRNMLSASIDWFHNCNCTQSLTGTTAPEAAANLQYDKDWRALIKWTFPATSRLLIDASVGSVGAALVNLDEPGVTPADVAITDTGTGFTWGSRALTLGPTGSYGPHIVDAIIEQGTVSYVTGSHSFKAGALYQQAWKYFTNIINNNGVSYTFKNGVPQSITLWLQPQGEHEDMSLQGYFAQDQWTLFHRLTLNYGLRLDVLRGKAPAQCQPMGPLLATGACFTAVSNIPNWKDLGPRVGAAYDLAGNGKTVVKGFLGRYVAFESANGFVSLNNPVNTIVTSTTRTWNDTNKNFIPDCNLTEAAANGECGPLANSAFGTSVVNTFYAANALSGFDHRGYNWQGSASLERQLRPGIELTLAYYRTWYGNFLVEENTDVTAADFSPYCVTAPVDSRLPSSVRGAQLCNNYNVNPSSFGVVSNLITPAAPFGHDSNVYNGFDLTTITRWGKGAQLAGGVSIGQDVTDNCFLNNQPQLTPAAYPPSSTGLTAATNNPGLQAYCHVAPPWIDGTQAKIQFIYPLPLKLRVSATYQNLPGVPVQATDTFTNAEIAPSLGRNLSGGVNSTVKINLMPPNQTFEQRLNQLDLRFTKLLTIKERVNLQANADLDNILNASTILTESTTYTPPGASTTGAAWLKPSAVLGGRVLKGGVNFNF